MTIETGTSFRLDNEVAVVTGGAAGLGRAMVDVLAGQGAHVVVLDIDAGGADTVASEIVSSGGSAEAHPLDVLDEAAVDKTILDIATGHGHIDILVNNAGISQRLPATEMPRDVWERVMGINTTGVFLCARSVARHMIVQNTKGRIVNIASIMGFSGGVYPNAAYNTSKGAVVNMTRALAVEWAPYGIRVNAVGPTWVRTNLAESLFANPDTYEEIKWFTPMGKEARPADIAYGVLFLAAHESKMITGHTLPIDGGFLAW
jgi:NAD(P)-dependent dehydrogenase (short-subunit alcohol dehydrogenase family)